MRSSATEINIEFDITGVDKESGLHWGMLWEELYP